LYPIQARVGTADARVPIMTTLGKLPHIPHPPALRAPPRTATAAPSTYACFESEMRMIPGVRVPLRSMYIDTGMNHGVLISPIATPDEAAVAQRRPVTLLAPSLLHHLHLGEAIDRYHPDDVWGPPGLAEKCPALGGVRVLGEDTWPFAATLDFALIEGAPFRNEVVLFHRASRTIYTADLVFNLHDTRGLLAPLAMRMMGIHDRFAVARMWRSWVKDRAAFQRSLDQVLAWDFDRIVMAHGEIVTHGGAALLVRALRERGLYRW
jgi:hypothetical protein